MNIITAFQVGDRLELGVRDESLQQGLLPLEPALSGFFGQSDVAVVIDHTPEPIRLRYDVASGALQSAQLRPSLEVKLLYEPSWGTWKGNVVSCHCDCASGHTSGLLPKFSEELSPCCDNLITSAKVRRLAMMACRYRQFVRVAVSNETRAPAVRLNCNRGVTETPRYPLTLSRSKPHPTGLACS